MLEVKREEADEEKEEEEADGGGEEMKERQENPRELGRGPSDVLGKRSTEETREVPFEKRVRRKKVRNQEGGRKRTRHCV